MFVSLHFFYFIWESNPDLGQTDTTVDGDWTVFVSTSKRVTESAAEFTEKDKNVKNRKCLK